MLPPKSKIGDLSRRIARAREAIAGIADVTPVLYSAPLARAVGADVHLKLENLQVTGSFKVRGAANKMLSLSPRDKERGVITCSSGNHGRAVAYVGELLGIPTTVCVPEWVDPSKLEAIRRHGAETILYGKTYDEAEERSLQLKEERTLAYVHPFDDPDIIAGQGTIGLEMKENLSGLDTVVVPLSGGGLIAGIAAALKAQQPTIRAIGVLAENAPVMYESLNAGRPIACPEEETIANALAGGIGLDNRYSFQAVRDLVDEFILVPEEDIREAMAFAAIEHKLVVEGGGAVGIAALLTGKAPQPGRNVGVVVSGGNVDLRLLLQIISGEG